MKKLLFVLLFIGVINSFAQESNNLYLTKKNPVFIGVEAGFNLTLSDTYDDKFLNEFLGLSFDLFFTNSRSFKTKIKYLKVNRTSEVWDWYAGIDNDNIPSYNAEFIVIPLLYKWQFGKSRAKYYVQGGVYFGLGLKDEYQNYPMGFDGKFYDFGINVGAGVHFPLFENGLYFYSEFEIYKGFVSKVPGDSDYYMPLSLEKTLTNLLFSMGFKYKF